MVDDAEPPLRIFFGSGGLPMTRAEYARRIETWEAWNELSLEAQGDLAAKRAGHGRARSDVADARAPMS